ncbi:ATP synthase F0 subunit a [Candidatus Karelsulcia muelleri CARI]|uniref:ATP synthase subunit a n=1 Tax=Karelsulcia muelleri (strain CARI) TaxID=706194 RepID=E0TJ99_KARMC|nr:ATP synthase F0 subunit a [Candidatus Karelsulcia muelleri CARI]
MSHKKNLNFLFIFFFWFSQLICLDTKTINCFDNKKINNKEIEIFTKKEIDKKEIFNPAFFIKNHIIDSHKWHFFKKKDKDYFIPLPIILFDKKLKLFLSSKFNQGKNLVLKKKNYYRLFNEIIYKTNSEGNLEIDDKGNILNKNPFDFSITKDVFALIISLIILFLIFFKLSLTYKKKLPKSKFQNILEYIILFIRDQIAIPNIGKPYYKLYFPFLLTIFFFILINNLIGLIPTGPNLTGNISVTFTLSTIVFFTIIFSANKDYWKHFFTMPDIPFLVRLLLIPIELFGLFIRPLTLCIRLFANITAGHIISMSFISLIFIFKNLFSIIISIPFSIFIFLLEILVSFLQAFIFTSLSALFLGISIKID